MICKGKAGERGKGLLSIILSALLLAPAGPAVAASGGEVSLLFQTRVDRTTPNEVFLATWDSVDSFLLTDTTGSNATSALFLDLNVSSDFEVAGLGLSGEQPNLLFQSRLDRSTPNEVFLARWNTLGDFKATDTNGSNANLAAFLDLNVSSDFTIIGFDVFDSQPYVLFQSRFDRTTPNEVFLARWNSIDDFLTTDSNGSNANLATFLNFNVSSDYRIAGFDIFDAQPYLLFQSRIDRTTPNEVFLARWNSIGDFLTTDSNGGNVSLAAFLNLNVSSDYRIAGFSISDRAALPGVPEPASWALLILGFCCVGAAMRTTKGRARPALA